MDMDKNRVDKVLAVRTASPQPLEEAVAPETD
jgi:hypothetical protein